MSSKTPLYMIYPKHCC